MLNVHVQKDIAEYEMKVVGSLTARRLISIILAVGLPVLTGVYLVFIMGVEKVDEYTPLFVVECVGFWCLGFIKPKGMNFEKFLPKYLSHKFGNNHVFYRSSMYGADLHLSAKERAATEDRVWKKIRKTNAIEKLEA